MIQRNREMLAIIFVLCLSGCHQVHCFFGIHLLVCECARHEKAMYKLPWRTIWTKISWGRVKPALSLSERSVRFKTRYATARGHSRGFHVSFDCCCIECTIWPTTTGRVSLLSFSDYKRSGCVAGIVCLLEHISSARFLLIFPVTSFPIHRAHSETSACTKEFSSKLVENSKHDAEANVRMVTVMGNNLLLFFSSFFLVCLSVSWAVWPTNVVCARDTFLAVLLWCPFKDLTNCASFMFDGRRMCASKRSVGNWNNNPYRAHF